jgi:hypothetical protein
MLRRSLIGIVLCLLGACAVASPAAAAEAPAWRVTVTPNPTHLLPGSPDDAVQQVDVNATGGTFTLEYESPQRAEGEGTTSTTAAIPDNAAAAQVEAALDAALGSGAVTVTGAGAGETAPYTVTFSGSQYSDIPQLPLVAAGAGMAVKRVTVGAYEPELLVEATNVGGPTNGSTITLEDTLPPGVSVTEVRYGTDIDLFGGASLGPGEPLSCSNTTSTVTCSWADGPLGPPVMIPGDVLYAAVKVHVASDAASPAVNQAKVSGGGSQELSSSQSLTVSGTPAGFEIVSTATFAAMSGSQAGGHPSVTSSFALGLSERGRLSGKLRAARFDLPRGLVAQAAGMPRCTIAKVAEESEKFEPCPSDTMVGTAIVTLLVVESDGTELFPEVVPVFNIVPNPGEPVAFGFEPAAGVIIRLDSSVLSNGSYAASVGAEGISELAGVAATQITIWGVPDEYNGAGPDRTIDTLFYGQPMFGGRLPNAAPVPLITGPQQCASPLSATFEASSWEERNTFVKSQPLSMGTQTGCELLRFEPKFTMAPDTLTAGEPAGYDFNLDVPQHNEVGNPATPNVKDVSLTLPEGTVVNPSAAWGLQACSEEQFYGPGHPSEAPAGVAKCPTASEVGTVKIKTPALEEALEGTVFLAAPKCKPCTAQQAEDGEMVRLYVQAVSEGEAGIVVKIEGHGDINRQTGQITTTFENNPQLPFSEFNLKLTGGERAVLANPRTCGPVDSSLHMTPWDEALPEASLTSLFEVNQGCFGAQFKPSFTAGMPNIQAGEHGEFTLAFGREDHDQMLKQITLHMPLGLLGTLTGVELCKQAQANTGTCGQNSLIGESQVLTGPGANPFLVEGGKVYLTEGYGGSQFGLSIVVPAVAGPYTLGGLNGEGQEVDDGTVVVRTQLFIDPQTAQITAVSGTLPSVLDGIPLQLKAVNVKLNRPGFMFNPTSCEKMAITGTVASVEGMSANVSSPFQVTNCADLAFKPQFSVSTSGKTSRANGASLHVKLAYPNAPFGTQANIAKVKVDLPTQLPSRLTTLQKACPDSVFTSNPAGCGAESRIGTASATTPILPVALSGPVYFVSHGGAKFPELIVVLSGYGVTVQLHSETFINKAGITSSTFRAIPDVPVNTFELTLPQGKFSALAANGNLCAVTSSVLVKRKVKVRSKGHTRTVTRKVRKTVAGSLVMPTAFTAQNGAVIHQNTPVEATGCGKSKAKKAGASRHGKLRKSK